MEEKTAVCVSCCTSWVGGWVDGKKTYLAEVVEALLLVVLVPNLHLGEKKRWVGGWISNCTMKQNPTHPPTNPPGTH